MLNFLRNTYAVLRRELTRLAHQPMYFVLMLVLPVVSFAFFALLFNKGVARDIPIAVLDQDHTSLSRKVTQMIDDTATAMVSYGIQDMDEGERLMREGKILYRPLMRISELIIRFIDWFYRKPVAAILPRQTFRYVVCGGANVAFSWVCYFLVYNFVLDKEQLDLGFVVVSAYVATMLLIFPFTSYKKIRYV